MSSTDAWMPLVIGDYLGATSHLTMEQSGAYVHLLMHQWRAGSVPADEGSLARLCRCTTTRWRNRIGPKVLAFFTVADGALVQPRLQRERRKAGEKSQYFSTKIRSRWIPTEGLVSNENNEVNDTLVYTCGIPDARAVPSPSDSKQERVKESAGADSKKYSVAGFTTMMTQPEANADEVDVFMAAAAATPTAPPVSTLPKPPPDPAPAPVPA